MRRKNAGLSLLEVLIASTILVGVVAAAMVILHSTSRTAANGSLLAQVEQRSNRTLTFIQDQMATAAFFYPGSNALLGIVPGYTSTAFGYQLSAPPTGLLPNGGAYVKVYGYPDPTLGTMNDKLICYIRFEADTVYKESSASTVAATQALNWSLPINPSINKPNQSRNYPTLDSTVTTTLNMDLNKGFNGNGNRTETFVSGKIWKYLWNTSTNKVVATERLDDLVLLRVNSAAPGDFTGDIDGDGTPDPLFTFYDAAGAVTTSSPSAVRLQVNLWHAVLDDSGKSFLLRNNKLIVHLRSDLMN
jgi:hypothetical protein